MSTAPDPKEGMYQAIESFVCLCIALLVVLAFSPKAHADVVSEFGGGYKMPATTSVVLLPECHSVVITETRPDTPEINYRTSSCGGDNPAFVGWPIAWEREYANGALRFRGGWYHYSNWLDGGRDRETHMDCACATLTVNWSQVRRNRVSRR